MKKEKERVFLEPSYKTVVTTMKVMVKRWLIIKILFLHHGCECGSSFTEEENVCFKCSLRLYRELFVPANIAKLLIQNNNAECIMKFVLTRTKWTIKTSHAHGRHPSLYSAFYAGKKTSDSREHSSCTIGHESVS